MGQVPTTSINALYTNTTSGQRISSTIMDAAIQDIVATININDSTAITTAKIALLAITTALLADNSVTSAKILDGTITTGDIADLAITVAKIADGAITSAKIADGTIVNADINTTAAIDGSKLANLSITSAQIADGTIMNVDINTSAAIDAAKIGPGTVSNAVFGYLVGVTGPIQQQLTNATLGAIADGSITDVKLDNGATSVKAIANAALPKTGGAVTGALSVNPPTGKQLSVNTFMDIGGGSGGEGVALNNAYYDYTTGVYKYKNTSGAISARGIRFSYYNGLEYFDMGAIACTADATFTPTWLKMWHAGNDGVGSGLDADFLDGLDSLAFVKADGSVPISGSLSIAGSLTAGAGGSFANSKAANGYQKLPGGLIMQWGSATIASGALITFPIAFPTAVTSITATCGAASPVATSANSPSPANVPIYHGNGATATLIYWMAIGY